MQYFLIFTKFNGQYVVLSIKFLLSFNNKLKSNLGVL